MHIMRCSLWACALVLGFSAAPAGAEFAQSRKMVVTGEGLREKVTDRRVSAEHAPAPTNEADAPPATRLGPVPGSQWTYNDPGYSVPATVALSLGGGTAWVGQDLNSPRLQRFALGGTGLPTDLPLAGVSHVYTAAAQDVDLAVRVVITTSNQIKMQAFDSTSSSPLWSFDFPSNYVYVREQHTRVARSGAVVCCAVRQTSPSTASRVYFLDGVSGAEINHWDYAGSVEGVDLTDKGDLCLVTQSLNGRLIKTATATEIFTGTTIGGSWVGRISGDGNKFVLGGQRVRSYFKSGADYVSGLNYTPSSAEFFEVGISRDGSTVAAASTDVNFLTFRMRTFNTNGGAPLGLYSVTGTGSYQDSPVAVVLADDGSIAAAATWGSENNSHPEAMVFDRTCNVLGSVDTPGSVISMDLSRDGVYMLVGSTPEHVNAGTSGGRVTLYQVRAAPMILRVDADAAPGGNGLSWSTAYKYLQDALAAARVGDEIWVAEGVYKPDQGVGQIPGDRNASFKMKTGVGLYGGFQGVTPAPPGLPGGETQREQRDWQAHSTVLSGDLAGNDGPNYVNYGENTYAVLWASTVGSTTVLDGFTVEAGNYVTASFTGTGGGLYCYYSSMTVRNCTFRRNVATGGGGVFIFNNADAVISNCTFIENASQLDGGAGLRVQLYSNPSIVNCQFIGNQQLGATSAGGAAFNWVSSPVYINCLFSGNRDRSHGGAMHVLGGSAEIINCTVANNDAFGGASAAGGVYISSTAVVAVKNSIFWGNHDSGGVNQASQIRNTGTLTISNTCVQGWDGTLGGVGNHGQNPVFADADGIDNQAGTLDDDLRLTACSPAREGGSNSLVPAGITTDLDENPRIVDGDNDGSTLVDMGCYEASPAACEPILYVKADAPAGGNGASWASAFSDLQSAMDAASSGFQICVAAGTYRPSKRTDAANARSVTFALKNGVAIFGGFAGTESALNQRDCAANETILSGDLNGDDSGNFSNNTENAYHVVTGGGTDGTAILDGFTISRGNADGQTSTSYRGGGMYNSAGSPTVRNCRFIANRSYYEGGGMYNTSDSHATVVNCVFLANLGYVFGGGAMYNSSSNPTIVNCTFGGNSSRAIYNSGATPVIRNCIFWENSGSTLADQIYPTATGNVSYSCIQGSANPGVNGNINGNPLFFNAPLDPYDLQRDVRLRPGSPCLDAGNNTYLPADESDLDGDGDTSEPLPFDLAGAPRAADYPCAADTGVGPGPIVDMGALERVPVPATAAPRLYVNQNAAGANTGLSWADAFTELQSALALAYDNGCIVDEIWVAAGSYKPTDGVDRTATFTLASGVAVYGGFSGGEMALEQRNFDPATNGCVLSGDIGAAGDPADNSYTVVEASFTDAACVLDGFTIRDGNADAPVSNLRLSSGGGIEIVSGSPTIARCRISNNQAVRYGAGVYIDEGSSPTLADCTIADNLLPLSALYGLGAGAFVDNDSHPSFLRCQFINNAAPDKRGGALCARQAQTIVTMSDCLLQSNTAWSGAGLGSDISASWILTRCRFINNAASTNQPNPQILPMGGAVNVLGGTHLVTNCQFIGNTSTGHAGALLIGMANSAHFANCLFSRNTAAVNGGVVFGEAPMSFANCTFSGNAAQGGLGGALAVSASTLNIANSILWGNTDSAGAGGGSAQIYLDPVDGPSTVSASFTVVQDAQPADGTVYAGAGNLDLDPQFANAGGDDLTLLPDSPCIDAGNNSAVPADGADLDGDGDTAEPMPLDLGGMSRFVDDLSTTDTGVGTPPIVDMGAYEYEYVDDIGPTLVSAVSRKTHGSAGDFDVDLSGIAPAPVVECRKDGPTKVILTFSEDVVAEDGTADGTEVGLSGGTLGAVTIASREMTVNVSGAADMTCLTITLTGITDLAGNPLTGPNTVLIRVLLGDTNGTGAVSVADVNQTRSRSGQIANASNFRSDTNCTGAISVADVNQVRSRSGNACSCP